MVEETVLFGMGQWMESAVSVDTKTVEETKEIMIGFSLPSWNSSFPLEKSATRNFFGAKV